MDFTFDFLININLENKISKSWFSIAQRYSAGLRAGWSVVRVPGGARNFSLHHRIQTGSGVHPASYPMGTRGSFRGGKCGRSVKLTTHLYLVPISRMRGAVPPLSQYASMVWCSVKVQRQLYLYILPPKDRKRFNSQIMYIRYTSDSST
jgi:hypothetical protein